MEYAVRNDTNADVSLLQAEANVKRPGEMSEAVGLQREEDDSRR